MFENEFKKYLSFIYAKTDKFAALNKKMYLRKSNTAKALK